MGARGRVGMVRRRASALVLGAIVAIPFVASGAAGATADLFAPYESIPLGTDTSAVAIGDVTGDGRPDVVATSSQGFSDYRVYVVAGLSDGGLGAPVSYATAASGSHRLETVAVVDVTADGLGDVVVAAAGLGIQVFAQQPDGTLGAPTTVATTDSLRIRTGHFGGGPGLDLVGIGWGSDTATVLLDDGHGGLSPATVYSVQHDGYDDLEVADITGDGLDDVVVMSGQGYATPNVSVLAQRATGGFAAPSEHRVGDQVNSNGIGVGDVTGDGRVDVVAAYGGNRPASHLAVFAQTTAGALAGAVHHPSYDMPTPVEVADLDRDGRSDVVVLHSGWLRAGVYRGQADGTLGTEELYSLPVISTYDPHGLAVGDVTGDGWADVVIADANKGVVILRSHGDAPPEPSPSPSVSASPDISAPPSPAPSASEQPSPTPTPTPTPEPPSAPTNLTASPNLPAGVGVSWSPPVSSGTGAVIGYRIYRSTDGQPWAWLATINNVLSHVDGTIAPGGSFAYRVSAISRYGEGPQSEPVAGQRAYPPAAPTGVAASAGKGTITLTWSAAGSGGSPITGYRLYRGTSPGAETFYAGVGAGTTTFTDGSVTRKVRYYYRLSATNNIGEGALSAEVSAAPR